MQMEVSMSTATEVREPEVQEPVKVRRPPRVLPSPAQAPEGPLFADVLLETSSLQRRRRTLATVLSIFFQCLLVGGLLLVPLMYTETLPRQQLLSFLIAPPPPPPPPPPAASAAAAKVVERMETDIMDGRLRTPGRIPQKVQMIREDEAPPAAVFWRSHRRSSGWNSRWSAGGRDRWDYQFDVDSFVSAETGSSGGTKTRSDFSGSDERIV